MQLDREKKPEMLFCGLKVFKNDIECQALLFIIHCSIHNYNLPDTLSRMDYGPSGIGVLFLKCNINMQQIHQIQAIEFLCHMSKCFISLIICNGLNELG